MNRESVESLLRRVAAGEQSVDAAADELAALPVRDLGFARLDTHRALRQGFPEVVFGAGKTPEQVARIMAALAEGGDDVLATRLDDAHVEAARAAVGRAYPAATFEWDEVARTLLLRQRPFVDRGRGEVLVVCAGTSDLPVAREALCTARALGHRVDLVADVGVAGLHRVLAAVPQLRDAAVLIVVAGMEGALPSVVGGLVDAPVIAVPTSVGYGASLGGLTALLAMMASCAPGITVVNVDNGFGAAFAAGLIARG